MRSAVKRYLLLPTLTLCSLGTHTAFADDYDPTAVAKAGIAKMKVGAKDWPQWGGSPERNNVPETGAMPTEFNVKTGLNIRWSVPLGSETYGNPVIANGKVCQSCTILPTDKLFRRSRHGREQNHLNI